MSSVTYRARAHSTVATLASGAAAALALVQPPFVGAPVAVAEVFQPLALPCLKPQPSVSRSPLTSPVSPRYADQGSGTSPAYFGTR